MGLLGGLQATIATMKSNVLPVEQKEQGCKALQLLTDGIEANSVSLKEKGGLETTIDAMNLHPSVVALQQAGLGVLANVLGSAGGAGQVIKHNGLSVINRAMEDHPNDVELQRCGIVAF